MSVTEADKLVAGQPIKFRYSGPTEDGAEISKKANTLFIVEDYLTGLLKSDPKHFLERYEQQSSPEVKKFTEALICGWAYNWRFNKQEEFDRWYETTLPEMKKFIDNLKLDEVRMAPPLPPPVPADITLPSDIEKKIDEELKRIDEDRGVPNFTYGVMGRVYPGYKGVFSFELGGGRWADFCTTDITDSFHTYEVEPVTKEEMLSGLQAEIDAYEPLIVKGGLEGAVEARKQFLLQELYKKLDATKSHEERLQVMESDNRFPAPETGFYVLIPRELIPQELEGEEKPFAVRANPRYDEDEIAGLIGILKAKERGFEILRGFETLIFEALEVPEKALGYIKEAENLEVRLS